MTPIIHRVNSIKGLEKVPSSSGIELDVRSSDAGLILNHEPGISGESFSNFLEVYSHDLLVVNIKEAGIEKDVINSLSNNNIENYFLLDIEFPFLLQNHKQLGQHLSVRFSKYESIETANNFAKTVNWLWIDTYEDFEINSYNAEIIRQFNTCLVSPTRWGMHEKLEYFIQKFKKYKLEIDYVMIENGEIAEY